MSATLSYQRELTRGTVLELRYLHTAGRHLPVQIRLNGGVVDDSRLVMPTFLTNPTADQLAGRPTLGSLNLHVDPDGTQHRFPTRLGSLGFLGSVTSFEPEGNSVYDGASVSLTRRMTRGLGADSGLHVQQSHRQCDQRVVLEHGQPASRAGWF